MPGPLALDNLSLKKAEGLLFSARRKRYVVGFDEDLWGLVGAIGPRSGGRIETSFTENLEKVNRAPQLGFDYTHNLTRFRMEGDAD